MKHAIGASGASFVRATVVISVLVAGLLYPALAHEGHNDAFQKRETATTQSGTLKPFTLSPASQQAIGLTVQTVQPGSFSSLLKVSGEVQPAESGAYDITPTSNALVKAVFAKPGDRVRTGQTLAILHSMEVSSILGQLLQTLVQIHVDRQHVETQILGDIGVGKNDLALTKAAFQREKALLTEGIAARKDYLETQTAYQNARVRLVTLQQRLAQERHHYQEQRTVTIAAVKSQLAGMGLSGAAVDQAIASNHVVSEVPVLAPASGIISFRELTLGQTVAPGKRIFSIVKLSPVWIILDVYQAQIPSLHLGQTVRLSAANGVVAQGVIDSIGSVLDPVKRTLPVRVVAQNESGALRPQLFVTAEIATRKPVAGRFILPASALMEQNDASTVLVRQGQQFQPVVVSVGQKDSQQVEVTEGLYPGDQVVIHGLDQIRAQALITASETPGVEKHSHGDAAHPPTMNGWLPIVGGVLAGMLLMLGLIGLLRWRKQGRG